MFDIGRGACRYLYSCPILFHQVTIMPPKPGNRIEPGQSTETWPRAPVHRLVESGVFMVTAATYRKEPLFAGGPKLRLLHRALLDTANRHGWRLEAWAVFPNHYHFIAASPPDPATLSGLIRELHSRTSIALNRHDECPGRKVWQYYWKCAWLGSDPISPG